MNENITAATLLSVTNSYVVFTGMLPPLREVRRATGQHDLVNDVRMAEAAASALVIATGVVASSLTKSPIPAMVTIVAVVGLVCMYESVLSATPKEALPK